MSTATDHATTAATPTDGPGAHEPHGHVHPTDGKYVKIALILAVITAAEVATYFTELNAVIIGALITMMTAKFIIVASYFMHLKYDHPIFKRVFVFGLMLAVAVFLIALTTFDFWDQERFLKFLTGG
jgi:cytochrome c oxidase subunit 4